MPFTPTHVLAVVPIAAARPGLLPFAALAIGAMIPDLPLFLPDAAGLVGWSYGRSHSVGGLVATDLPMGLASYVAFIGLLRRPLVALLPEAWQARCGGLLGRGLARTPGGWLRVAVALMVGAATHLVWDSFTHRGRWGVGLVPGLDAPILSLAGQAVPGHKVLQYGSTLVGLPLLAILAAIWLRRQEPRLVEGLPRLPAAGKAAVLLGLVAVAVGAGVWAGRVPGMTPYERLGRGIARGGLALGLAILAYSIAFEGLIRRAGLRSNGPRQNPAT